MAVDKKFFVDINLQGNALNNATIGSNSDMTKGGSFRFDGTRLEYYNGSSVQSVANLADISAVTGGLILQGGYNAATNTPVITNGTALKGYFWVVTAAGSFLGESVQVGDSLVATVDNAGASIGDWLILQGNVVIASETVDGIVRLATQAEVDAGTEGGAVVLTPATFENSTQLSEIRSDISALETDKLSRDGSQAMEGNLDMGGNDITNINDIAAGSLSGIAGQNINLINSINASNASTIINLPTPISGADAANKTYVDDQADAAQAAAEATASADATAKADAAQAAAESFATTAANQALTDANSYTDSGLALKLNLTGGTMSGGIDMVSNAISNPYLSNATLSDALNADDKAIINLADPTNAQDAATKNYVDYQLGASVFSSSFADTDWTLSGGVYTLNVAHNVNTSTPKVASYVSGNLVEFAVVVIDANTIELKSNIAAPASVSVGVSK